MKQFRKNSKLLSALANEVSSPNEFISILLNIYGISKTELARRMGTSQAYVSMICNGHPLATKAIYKFSKALNFDPYVVGRLMSDFNMKKLIENDGL